MSPYAAMETMETEGRFSFKPFSWHKGFCISLKRIPQSMTKAFRLPSIHLPNKAIDLLPVYFGIIVSLSSVIWCLYWSRYGLDLTDEGYYLNFISNPWAYSASTSQFGFMHAPIFAALERNIVLLRQVNILATFLLSVLFFLMVLKSGARRDSDGVFTLSTAGLFGFCAFLSMIPALWTPSYNTLNLQALLLAGIGFVLIHDARSRHVLIGSVVVGLAGWMAFAAKPPTAIGMAVVALFYFSGMIRRNLYFQALAAAFATAAIVTMVMSLMIDGSPVQFAYRLREGLRLNQLTGGYTLKTLLPFDPFYLGYREILFGLGGVALGFAGTSLCLTRAEARKFLIPIGCLAFAAFSLFALGVGTPDWIMPRLLIVTPAFGIVLAALCHGSAQNPRHWPPRELGLAVSLTFFPMLYALGTNGHFWNVAAGAGLFWIAAAVRVVLVLHPDRASSRTLIPLALTVNAATMLLLSWTIFHPYRADQPLPLNDRVVDLGRFGFSPIVSQRFGDYLEWLRVFSMAKGFRPSEPMIDLTGNHPTSLLAMNALPIGQAWTIGGYPGSEDRARAALRLVPCRLVGAAWLLTEPESRTFIRGEKIGLANFEYVSLGSIVSPEGSRQYLLKPLDPAANAASCRRQRRSEN